MPLEQFLGVLAAVILGNGLSVAFFFAIFWGDAQIKRGASETNLPWWFYVGGTLPPIIGAVAAYVALY